MSWPMRCPLWLFIGLALLLASPLMAQAQESSDRAALVIVGADGAPQTHCVAVEPDETSGYEALVRTQLALAVDVSGMGLSVCRIGEIGCPAEDCFCRCRGGGDCAYWSYWRQVEDEWRYSQAGAQATTVAAGGVEAWVWGAGAPGEAQPPPPITFDAICLDPTEPLPAAPQDKRVQTGWQTYLVVGLAALFLLLGVVRLGRAR